MKCYISFLYGICFHIFPISIKIVPLIIQWEVLASMYIFILIQINKRSSLWFFYANSSYALTYGHIACIVLCLKEHANDTIEFLKFIGSWVERQLLENKLDQGCRVDVRNVKPPVRDYAKQKCKEILEREEGQKGRNLVYF